MATLRGTSFLTRPYSQASLDTCIYCNYFDHFCMNGPRPFLLSSTNISDGTRDSFMYRNLNDTNNNEKHQHDAHLTKDILLFVS